MAKDDLQIDCSCVHFAARNITTVEESLTSLASALGNTRITNPEVTTASLIDSSKTLVEGKIKTAIEEIKRRLTNTKNVLINFDREAALFFQYVDTGVLDENLYFTTVPLYSQTDYNNGYAGGTISSSGCGLTSMSMALSYVYNDILTPDELLRYTTNHSNLESKMLGAAEGMGAKFTVDNSVPKEKFDQLLKQGKMIISLVKNNSHFVLVTGMTADGKYVVNDPYGPWQKNHTYTWAEIERSSSRAWIVDPYANVGNAKTNIGRVTVSNAAAQAIQEANGGSGTVQITNKKYINNVNNVPGSIKAGFSNVTLAPTAIAMQKGQKMSDIVASRRASGGMEPGKVEATGTEDPGTQTTNTPTTSSCGGCGGCGSAAPRSTNQTSTPATTMATTTPQTTTTTTTTTPDNTGLLTKTGADIATEEPTSAAAKLTPEEAAETTESIKDYLSRINRESTDNQTTSSTSNDITDEEILAGLELPDNTRNGEVPTTSNDVTPSPTVVKSSSSSSSIKTTEDSNDDYSFATQEEMMQPLDENGASLNPFDDTDITSDLLNVEFFSETNKRLGEIASEPLPVEEPVITPSNPEYDQPADNTIIHSDDYSKPSTDTNTTIPGIGTNPNIPEAKPTPEKSGPNIGVPLALIGLAGAGAAVAYTVGKKKKNEE